MQAFVIHTPGDARRERNVERLAGDLQAAGVAQVEVVPGVRPADRGPMMSVGEWGCYQSHLSVLRRVAELPGPALVLEDDAVLVASPERLARLLAASDRWDLLHLGYQTNTVFRAWDRDLMSRELLRVRGVLYGSQCYAVRPASLAGRLEVLERMAHEPPEEGGGVGYDGALCELAWRDPSLVRLAPPVTLFRELPGVRSGLRPTSPLWRVRARVVAALPRGRTALRRA